MKKNVLLPLFILLIIAKAQGQQWLGASSYPTFARMYPRSNFQSVAIGFKFSPVIAYASLESSKEMKDLSAGSSGLRMTLGPIVDFYFSERYAFSTGLWYTVKAVNFDVNANFYNNQAFVSNPLTTDEEKGTKAEFNLQYLQVPATVKMFSSDIIDGLPLFLQFGGTFDLKIAEKPQNIASNALVQYRDRVAQGDKIFGLGDVNVLLGVGAETPLGRGSEKLFFGVQYQRGLVEINSFDNMITKNNQFVFDLGIKF